MKFGFQDPQNSRNTKKKELAARSKVASSQGSRWAKKTIKEGKDARRTNATIFTRTGCKNGRKKQADEYFHGKKWPVSDPTANPPKEHL